MERIKLISEENGIRLDKYLSTHTDYSRSRIQQMADEKKITVNEKEVRSSFKLKAGDVIEFDEPEDEDMDILPEDIPLDILYEDEDIIVINKPKGMIVHPAPGVYSGTLVNALLFHCSDLSGINGIRRPGIVHRIDKDTTGCLIACKNDLAHRGISAQLEDKTCHREYTAIVAGHIAHDTGMIDAPVGRDPRDRQRMTVTETNSREAVTHFRVIERFRDAVMVECALETGRTHQIRVHMKYIGHPVLGDEKYGRKCRYMDTQGQVLHAHRISFIHPRTHEEMSFEAPLPAYFVRLIEILRKESI